MRDHPDIHLEIQDMTVEAACQSLLRGETDLAFTSDAPRTDAIRAELVMTEPMALICAAGSCYSDGIGPDELPVRQEVYVEWTDEFARWHQELWGVDAVPRIQLEIMSQLQMFMTKRDSWAVVPRSVADGLCAAGREAAGGGVPLAGAPHPRAAEKGGKPGGCAAVSGHHPPAVGRSGGMSAKPRQRG